MKKDDILNVALFAIPITVILGLIVVIIWMNPDRSSPTTLEGMSALAGEAGGRVSEELLFSCTTDMATEYHVHPVITIVIDGVEQQIPTNIGITNACMHPIHTHDSTGVIHVESPVQKEFAVGDFFKIWGKPFSSTQILDKFVGDTHRIRMTVNGVENEFYENYIVKDHDEIRISYEAL